MAKTYFIGPKNTGVANSLMNLLVELDDTATALGVPGIYKNSPLTAGRFNYQSNVIIKSCKRFYK